MSIPQDQLGSDATLADDYMDRSTQGFKDIMNSFGQSQTVYIEEQRNANAKLVKAFTTDNKSDDMSNAMKNISISIENLQKNIEDAETKEDLKQVLRRIGTTESVISQDKTLQSPERELLKQLVENLETQSRFVMKDQHGIFKEMATSMADQLPSLTGLLASMGLNNPAIMFLGGAIQDLWKKNRAAAKEAKEHASEIALQSYRQDVEAQANFEEQTIKTNNTLRDIENGITGNKFEEIENAREGARNQEKIIDAIDNIKIGSNADLLGGKNKKDGGSGIIDKVLGLSGLEGIGIVATFGKLGTILTAVGTASTALAVPLAAVVAASAFLFAGYKGWGEAAEKLGKEAEDVTFTDKLASALGSIISLPLKIADFFLGFLGIDWDLGGKVDIFYTKVYAGLFDIIKKSFSIISGVFKGWIEKFDEIGTMIWEAPGNLVNIIKNSSDIISGVFDGWIAKFDEIGTMVWDAPGKLVDDIKDLLDFEMPKIDFGIFKDMVMESLFGFLRAIPGSKKFLAMVGLTGGSDATPPEQPSGYSNAEIISDLRDKKVININRIGDSKIKNWKEVEKLGYQEIQALRNVNDWSPEVDKRLFELSEKADISPQSNEVDKKLAELVQKSQAEEKLFESPQPILRATAKKPIDISKPIDILNVPKSKKEVNSFAGLSAKKTDKKEITLDTGEVRKGGHRNWRNYNPGNLEYGDFAKRHGAVGSDGRFAIFPDMETGYAAQKALLKGESYSSKNMVQAIKKFAPASENDPKSYVRKMEKMTGIKRTRKLNTYSDAEWDKFLKAQSKIEGMKSGTVIPAPTGKPVAVSQNRINDITKNDINQAQKTNTAPTVINAPAVNNSKVSNNNSSVASVTGGISPRQMDTAIRMQQANF